ncbi:MAG: glycerate kinase type-2 family protein [Myxococcota bacterium]
MGAGPGSRETLLACWRSALDAVGAGSALERSLESDPPDPGADSGGVWLLALGKASVPMARAAEARAGARLRDGLVVTKDGHGGGGLRSPVLEASHPVPDARSERAGRAALARAGAVAPDGRLWVLLSGGASSLLTRPLPGLTLDDVARTTRRLLEAGADIDELNTVRKHLTAVSGGRLARAAGGRPIDVRVVSDVPGDRLDLIASGPCAPDPSRFADARAVLAARGADELWPEAVRAHLEAGARGEREESPKPGDPVFARVRHTIVASNADARAAALAEARRRGLAAVDLGECLEGEARDAARELVRQARARRRAEPLVAVAGGETTVTVLGDGLGGRSQELALAAALELNGEDGIGVLAVGTDGTDGPTDAAGAYADPGSAQRGRRAGVDPVKSLERNDAYGFFDREGGIVRSGPTGTNVMDLVLIYVDALPARTPPVKAGR